MDGMRAFKFGARALAHYTLEHREEVRAAANALALGCSHDLQHGATCLISHILTYLSLRPAPSRLPPVTQVWDLLRWEGKHAQAPVAVAQKTHYFCELAVVPSVMALLGGRGRDGRGGGGREGGVSSTAAGFLSSSQWRECCADGAFLELDRRHFCRVRIEHRNVRNAAMGSD